MNKTMKCRCDSELFRILYNEGTIEAYCNNCNKLIFMTSSCVQPKEKEKPIDVPNVEDCQSQLVELMKAHYDVDNPLDIAIMKNFVKENLKSNKVQECKDINTLQKAYEILYNQHTNI